MADFAALGLAVDARPVISATAALDRLAKASASAQAAAKNLSGPAPAQMQAFERSTRAASAALDKFGRSTAEAGNAFGVTANQAKNLGFQINDVLTSIGSGAPVLQVLAQQGGQVYQALGDGPKGVTGSLKGIGSGLLGLITPARVVTAGVLGIGAAAALSYSQWSNAQRALENSLEGLGKSTRANVGQLDLLASSAASAAKVGVGSSREMIAAFASTGKIGTGIYGDLVKASRDYAAVTGTDSVDAAMELAKAFASPAKGAEDLDKKLNILDQSTLDYIRRLDSLNQKDQARQVLLDALRRNIPDATTKLNALGRAWQNVANFAGDAWTAMGRAVGALTQNPALDQRIAQLEALRAQQQRTAAGPSGRGSGNAATQLAQTNAELKKLYAERDKIQQQAQEAKDRSDSKEAGDASAQLNPEVEKLKELITLRTRLAAVANNPRNIDKPGVVDQAQYDFEKVEAQIRAITDANGALVPVSEKLRKEAELDAKAIMARTDAQKADVAAERARLQAQQDGAGAGETEARVEAARNQILLQGDSQRAQAARDRLRSINDNITALEAERDALGKTGGEQDAIRKNAADLATLQREAAEAGISLDKEQLAALQAKNAEYGKSINLLSQLRMRDDIKFDRDQLGRNQYDQQVAAAQKSAGLPVDLNSFEANALRVNATLADIKETSTSALTGFLGDIRNGTSALDALRNSLNKIADKLIDMAVNDLMSNAFATPGAAGGSGGGMLSSLFKGFSSLFTGHADGGLIRGPGSGTSDSIPARVSNGEYIVNAAATRANLPMLEAINDNRFPRFASGGLVTAAANAAQPSSMPVHVNINLTGANGDATIQKIAYQAAREGTMTALGQIPNISVKSVQDRQRRMG